ncbi:hypothetical protein CORC01_13387 [Colletotrichum orchidophilum]|uniref:Uncharacterized protein n=1 Tax=Colletotrichum orchidophilum TaxID=1209926 RepID=A0A1G4AQ70_9PEZI|nr:uncharacterized protein CORC01_13387 [Colletotrichum orchidophilum]OHE91314.1 hypothetical protein CORC01_13387 [Colletotrichum orchidophilum]
MAAGDRWYLVPQPTDFTLVLDRIYRRGIKYSSSNLLRLTFDGYFRILCLWDGEERFIREEPAESQSFRTWRKNNPNWVEEFRMRACKAGYWNPIRNDLRHTIFYDGQYFKPVNGNEAAEAFSRNPQPDHAKLHATPSLEWPLCQTPWVPPLGRDVLVSTINPHLNDPPPDFDQKV